MSNEIIDLLDINTISEDDLPQVISGQFDKLVELEENVQKSIELAMRAKDKAKRAKVSAGFGKKKEAIYLLQDAMEGSADAQISLADAQKISFEYQTKLTEIAKFLFGLGVSNIAMNQSVARELKLKLEGASEEEISGLAKQELRNVILQLKAQESIMKKQESLAGDIKKHDVHIKEIDRQLDDIDAIDDEQDEKLDEHSETLAEHDITLQAHQQKDIEFEKLFEEQEIEDKQQDKKIEENSDKLSQHDDILEEHHRAQEQLDLSLSEFKQNVAEDFSNLKAQMDEDNERLFKKICDVEKAIECSIENLKHLVNQNQNENCNISNALDKRVEIIEIFNSKKLWKIAVSAVAAVSLLLNILQICGVF